MDTEIKEQLLEQFRAALDTLPEAPEAGRLIKISGGVATVDKETSAVFATPELLVEATSRAVQAARGAGGACVRSFVPRAKAA